MSKKLRVGLISFHNFSQPGGVKRHVLGLYQEFKKRGIYSKVIAPRRKRAENYGKDIILLGTSFPFPFSGSKSDFSINFNPLAIKGLLEKEKFDILHFHNFGFPSTLQILERSDALNILTFHANVFHSKFLKKFPGFLYLLNKLVQWKIHGIIGVAPLTLKIFKNYKGPKIVIPNGIDLEEFNPRGAKIEKFSKDKINLLFVGRIEERKGLIYLLKAFKILLEKFPNKIRLFVVGEGDLKEECQDYVKENNLKEVHFEGEITGEKLPAYYRSCDIFISPAIFGESFGLVLLEAMACQKPVVAFANTGYRQFLKGKKGKRFLAKNYDFGDLAKKVEILIKDQKLRKEMGEWGIKEAQNYSWPKIADQVLNFYKICQKEKRKKEEKILPFNEIFSKIFKKDLLSWLKLR
ncbi:MAG: glycosyltransferase family 4 protein [Patescibacteria group bacterium]|nr:glycosyltransferase family 4 protein [Patescibacteria group bacterium]